MALPVQATRSSTAQGARRAQPSGEPPNTTSCCLATDSELGEAELSRALEQVVEAAAVIVRSSGNKDDMGLSVKYLHISGASFYELVIAGSSAFEVTKRAVTEAANAIASMQPGETQVQIYVRKSEGPARRCRYAHIHVRRRRGQTCCTPSRSRSTSREL